MGEAASGYGMAKVAAAQGVAAPDLEYLPPRPRSYRPKIALIGCGGISEYHLRAYRTMGLDVAMLCDIAEEKAQQRQREFYPDAWACTSFADVLANEAIEVVDIALHPAERGPVIEAALRAGKHVLSQKPFVTDLAEGSRLCDLADACNRTLAVNQNGRWAPHFSYARAAIAAGLLGQVSYVDFTLQWDHTWTADTPFNEIRQLLLYDFGIHWFDICSTFFAGQEAAAVTARVATLPVQRPKPPMLAHVLIEYPHGQATFSFNGHVVHGQQDQTVISGDLGTLRCTGPSLSEQTVVLHTAAGAATPALDGTWFESGFQGAMGELLCAIEEDRTPNNNARDNLRGLALCFAACASADAGGAAIAPGTATSAPGYA